ncbi:WD repeat-containing and planar cell polarity effector protein fritz homolog [Ylistrum balloti]|uniref:WD repeat-containing and planar cell polarity effector protein fritz homolog n=1 Tax=Ylistrum balloti TaxID=509963 RepID=UPI002905B7B4|nr:WD repeat-containing and planar cell polarity effector protein fritz homolog [Ylistrum balloti]
MATCMGEVFTWSLRNQTALPDDVVGIHTYHDKQQASSHSQLYLEERQHYAEGQDIAWTPKNKRPEKLRDTLKELEDLLSHHRLVHVRWRSRRILQVVLSNLVSVTYVLSGHSGDLDKVFLDKSMMTKVNTDAASDAYLCEQFLITVYPDRNKLDYAYFVKRPPLGEAIKRLEKLSAWEPKVSQVEIPGPIGRRLDRKLSVNTRQDTVLVWWTASSDEAWPWSPMTTDKDRANLVLLSIHGPNIGLLTFTRSECDPIHAGFSDLQPHRFFTVEQAMGAGSETSAQSCTYEIIQGKIQRTNVTAIQLKGHLTCQGRNPSEDKLILGCGDGSVVLIDDHRKTTSAVRAALIAADVAWHPTGTVFFLISVRGDIQVFDLALTSLRIQLVSEEPSPQRVLPLGKLFRVPVTVKELCWCSFDPQSVEWSGDYTDAMFIHCDRGPPCLFLLHLGVVSRERFSCLELMKEYIKHNQIPEAILLLENMNWDTHGSVCYSCLSAIVNHLLRKPLNVEREGQLEVSLGTFYNPKRALSESVIMDFRDPISRLARRFFHHLLRYSRFDKAFLLAVDIGARDLFMDIHYMAQDKGEVALAEVAKRKADQIETEALESFDGLDDDLIFNGFNGQIPNNHQDSGQNGQNYNQSPTSWQPDYAYTQGYRHQNSDTGTNRYLPYPDDVGVESDLIQDYTDALRIDDPSWIHTAGLHHHPQEDSPNPETEEDDNSANVIHFGVV